MAHTRWVQSTAATTSKQTYVRGTSGNASATMVNIGRDGERIDFRSRLSPDSTTLAVFSTAGDKDQKQLWILNADGLNPHKVTI